MKRSLIVCLLALLGAAALDAGAYENDVETLGNSVEASGAFERLAKAGDEAFDDLMDGLKLDPDEEGIEPKESARRGDIRRHCARLLGALKDTRASAQLLELLRAGESDPLLSTACANALGRIWADKDSSGEREEVATELKALAANAEADGRVRWAALHGLAHMGTGAEVAAPILADEGLDEPLRGAAIDVVVRAGDGDSADALFALWEKQRGGEAADYTRTLGVQALFGLAQLNDTRAVAGLVDVATLAQFASRPEWQDRAIGLMNTDDMRDAAVSELVGVFKDVDKPSQHQAAARTLGEFGATGVTAFLAVSDDEAPEGEDADHYQKQVDRWLGSLSSADALAAFIAAYDSVDDEDTDLQTRIFEHIYNNRRSIDHGDTGFFRTVADDESLAADKRAQAVNAWAEAQGKEALADLERWVKSEDGEIRAQAVQNLGRSYIPLAKSKPLLEEALQSEGEEFAEARRNALQGLQRSDDKELLPLFLERLDPEKEPDADVRHRAIQALAGYTRTAGIDDDEVYPALKARMDDADAKVRAIALNRVVVMANNLGRTDEATEIVEKGLVDNDSEVRIAAYDRVALVTREVDPSKVIRAALMEETREMKGSAVIALSNLDNFGEEAEQQKSLVDLALSVTENPSRRSYAKELLAAIDESVPALKKYITDSVRAQIESHRESRQYATLPVLIRTLIAIDDVTYFEEVKEMAEIANVELRKACIEYFAETGTKNDIPFLRNLKERTDSAADAVRGQIENAIRTLEDRG